MNKLRLDKHGHLMLTDEDFRKHMYINVFFIIILFGLAIASFYLPTKFFSETENRKLAQFPEVSVARILKGQFMTDYEAYISDQFPARDVWIMARTLCEIALQKKEINGIVITEDLCYIEKHNPKDFESDQAKINKDALIQAAKQISDKVGSNNFKIMLIPTAETIYQEKLPKYSAIADQTGFLNDIKEELSKNNLQNTYLDVESILQKNKGDYIFYKTDHHWTTIAAYDVYLEWAEEKNFEPIFTEDYLVVAPMAEDFFGTIGSKLNLRLVSDTLNLHMPYVRRYYEVEKNYSGVIEDDIYDWEKLETKDKYSIFLGGNDGIVSIKPLDIDNGKKLLFIKDSFGNSMVQFFVFHYSQVDVIDLRYFKMPMSQYLEENDYDDVIIMYSVPNFVTEKSLFYLK